VVQGNDGKINEKFLLKAERRFLTAKFAYEENFVCSAISNCYYALFNLMQAVVGVPLEGSWSHGGLPKRFTKVVFQKKLLPLESIKGIVKLADKLYSLRKEADYYDTILELSPNAKKRLGEYLLYVEGLLNRIKELLDANYR